MRSYSHLSKIFSFLLASLAILSTFACGSYGYASTDQDGIYSSEPKTRAEQPATDEKETAGQTNDSQTNDSGYYATYFGQESEKIQRAQEIMFTDVEAYSSNNADSTSAEGKTYYSDEPIAYTSGDPSWGSNPTEINVNYYNSGYYNPFYYDNGYGWGYPHVGISFSWGWHSPYGWFYNPYYYSPYYYGYSPYYYHPYYSNYYNPYYSGYYNRYYGRQTAYHPTYRNNYRSNDYNRGTARSENRNTRSSRNDVRSTDTNVRSSQERTNRNAVDRIRNPRNINAGTTRTNRTRSYNDPTVGTERNTSTQRTRTTYPTRTRTNSSSTRTRSSSNSNNSGTNVRTRSSSPSAPARSTRSSSSSGRRGGR